MQILYEFRKCYKISFRANWSHCSLCQHTCRPLHLSPYRRKRNLTVYMSASPLDIWRVDILAMAHKRKTEKKLLTVAPTFCLQRPRAANSIFANCNSEKIPFIPKRWSPNKSYFSWLKAACYISEQQLPWHSALDAKHLSCFRVFEWLHCIKYESRLYTCIRTNGYLVGSKFYWQKKKGQIMRS